MSPQQERAEATRQRIIGAGVELFDGEGFGFVDMVDVITRAGVSKGACYYHFPNKPSLAAAIVEESNWRIAAAMGPIWESEAPAMHRLIIATFRFLELIETDDTARIGYQLRWAIRQPRQPGERHFGDTEVIFTERLQRAITDGHVKADINPAQTAYTLFAALVGCQQLAEPFGDSAVTRFVEVWSVILAAIATDEHREALEAVVRAAAQVRSERA